MAHRGNIESGVHGLASVSCKFFFVALRAQTEVDNTDLRAVACRFDNLP
jgi:hypothetical protein